ncbi:50S ribosomal protein L23 [Nitrososphaera sp.]|uniref:50S ribosomal protein L23 n=1 Tax=Nitrososphaera sp. TaxID=1971748 RepID=UPI00307EBCC7
MSNNTASSSKKSSTGMTAEQATNIIIAPYVTEKTFNQIEKENKLSFKVAEKATKHQVMEAIRILYEAEAAEVNTARTIQGKKAFVRFKEPEGARNLATKLGLV